MGVVMTFNSLRMFGCLKGLVGGLLVMVANVAMANSCQISTGYFVDPTGELSSQAAFAHAYKPFQGVLNHGYTDATVWIRVDMTDCAGLEKAADDSWVVRIRPTYFDQVVLFMPNLHGAAPVAYTGDTTIMAGATYPSINLGFEISMAEVSNSFFLRARTQSSNTLKLEVLTKAQAAQADCAGDRHSTVDCQPS